jgi:DnaJ-class molecular chaperone
MSKIQTAIKICPECEGETPIVYSCEVCKGAGVVYIDKYSLSEAIGYDPSLLDNLTVKETV